MIRAEGTNEGPATQEGTSVVMSAPTYTAQDIISIAEDILGTETFDAVLSRIETAGRKYPEGSDNRNAFRRAYKYIMGLRDAGRNSLTGNDYKMGNSKTQVTAEVAAVAVKAASPRIGTFTVVMGAERVTLRIKKHWVLEEAAKGGLVVSFLSGSDNESDYTGFAFLSATGKLKVWNRFKGGSVAESGRRAMIIAATEFLTQGGDYEGAGHTYALESGNCYRCNRLLTVPASINRGLGPECAKKVN